MNGTWTVTWVSGCLWRYADGTIQFELTRKSGNWLMNVQFPDGLCVPFGVNWGTGPTDPSFCCQPSVLRRSNFDPPLSCGATGEAPFTIVPVDLDCCGGCPTCPACPNGSPRQWRFSFAGLQGGPQCPCDRANGDWIVTWISGCTWEFSNQDVSFILSSRLDHVSWTLRVRFTGFTCGLIWTSEPDPAFCCAPSILRDHEQNPSCNEMILPSVTIIPVDTDCCINGPCCNCPSVPRRWRFTVNLNNGGNCPQCITCSGDRFLLFDHIDENGVCVWYDEGARITSCTGGIPNQPCWSLEACRSCTNHPGNCWILTHFIDSQVAGSATFYEAEQATFNCLGGNDFTIVPGNRTECNGFPAIIRLTPA